jgi:maltooligosyltrehalose trehalohydrolase
MRSYQVAQIIDGKLRFRVWAPHAHSVEALIEGESPQRICLQPCTEGYFQAEVANLGTGTLYRYLVDGEGPYPDPASRFQPRGPHGPSMAVDPNAYAWSDSAWPGVEMKGQVIYEMHVGTFTQEGTFDAAIRELPALKATGITLLELLPVVEFPGRWNWGYDGVALFAPYHGYGDYEAFKRFVDAAHHRGLAVVLDVVYNHVGPDGSYLSSFSKDFFTDRYENEWGEALNFDGENSGPVREYFLENVRYWISEFHLDGLRLDATQSMHDSSSPHILKEIVDQARETARPRSVVIIGENEPQRSELLLPEYGLDALWNDDFHHSAVVALTGRREGYYHDHRGHAQEFVSAVKRAFLFQGQYYHWQKKPRGTPVTTQPASAFVNFIQNHDQVANTLYGMRLHKLTSPGRLRAITALLLLAPETPLLFMGQEFAASTPFPFFADHKPELAAKVHAGRKEFLSQFVNFATAEARDHVLDPAEEATFFAAKLDFSERETNAAVLRLHTDLLQIRREDQAIAAQSREQIDGAVLSDSAFVLRWGDDRLLLVNLGDELMLHPAPEPLLAPPQDAQWELAWSSDDPRYDGLGAVSPCSDMGWRVPGESAVLLKVSPVSKSSMAVGISTIRTGA